MTSKAMLSHLKHAILEALQGRNLVFTEGSGVCPRLRCFYEGYGAWEILYHIEPAGNAYRPEENEYSLEIGLDAGHLDYAESEEYKDEKDPEEALEMDATSHHIQQSLDSWANKIMDEIGPQFDQ